MTKTNDYVGRHELRHRLSKTAQEKHDDYVGEDEKEREYYSPGVKYLKENEEKDEGCDSPYLIKEEENEINN